MELTNIASIIDKNMPTKLLAQTSSSFGLDNQFIKTAIVVLIAIILGWVIWMLFDKLCDWWADWRKRKNETDV
jgi:hypothetical protein